MIRYSLACDSGHRFESWFHNSTAFDELAERQLVSCPTCASLRVAKTIMAPAVVATRPPTVSAATGSGSVDVSLLDEGRKDLRNLIQAVRHKVMAETQDVGARFPREARRMHDGDIPHRDIRGQATLDEARALLEDGIFILPLPPAPDELN